MDVHPLSTDPSFNFELTRCLALSRYRGADIIDVLQAAGTIVPGDFESWYSTWHAIAERTANTIADGEKYPVSARDRLLAAASYYRAADIYLHGTPGDRRIHDLWAKQTECFDKAMPLLEYPAKRYTVKADDFNVPVIFYHCNERGPRPTFLVCHGYGGSQEELLHIAGLAALERGYNVITFEGPGQPSVRRHQGKGFIHDWERVVTPVVDFALEQPSTDAQRIALMGYSLGGYLSVRAAAFEHRLAAVVACDGMWAFGDAMKGFILPEARRSLDEGDAEAFDKLYEEKLKDPQTPTPLRWAFEHGMWAYNQTSPSAVVKDMHAFTLEGLEKWVQCPVLDVDVENDLFLQSQAEKVKEKLGDQATYLKYTKESGGHLHCQLGMLARFNQDMFAWLDEKMG